LFFWKVILEKILFKIKIVLRRVIIALSKTYKDGIVLANGFLNNQDKVLFAFSVVISIY
jgi:hypothetical protein